MFQRGLVSCRNDEGDNRDLTNKEHCRAGGRECGREWV